MTKITLSTKPKVIRNKDISTLEFRLIFPIKQCNDNYHYISFLNLFLTSTNYLLHDKASFDKEKDKLTFLNIKFYHNSYEKNTYLIYAFSLPKDGLINDFNLEESFKFAIDCLLHPYCDNNEFNLDKFNYEKDFLLKNQKESIKGIYSYVFNKYYEKIDPNCLLGNSYQKALDVLEDIDNKKLYQFYKKNILDNNFFSYVYGDISETKVNKLFNKYIPQEKESITFNVKNYSFLPLDKRSFERVKTNYKQTVLLMEYQVEDFKVKDIDLLAIIINILNFRENNLIFDTLRIKQNLVYDVFIEGMANNGLFTVVSFISQDNLKIVKQSITNVLKEIENEEYLTNCYNRLIKGIEVDLLKEEDGLYVKLENEFKLDVKNKTLNDLLKIYKNVKIKDLLNLIKRLKLTNEMLFVGEEDD